MAASSGTYAAAQQYRIAMDMDIGLEGYATALDGSYRQSDILSLPGPFARLPSQHLPPHLGSSQPLLQLQRPPTVPSQRRLDGVPSREIGKQTGPFGMLGPVTFPDEELRKPLMEAAGRAHGPLAGRLVVDPPDLQAWRERLFNVDGEFILTNEQFQTYFPHVDNVYSHRSTQRYKRKPFVSHYWDCRMKGRPPGTPKSTDPGKQRRKRVARERDLCDVKIKITEYFSGEPDDCGGGDDGDGGTGAAREGAEQQQQQRLWTIQRVNGNGGNGKGDGVAGPHKHTLARSDEVKKNSVQRYAARQGGEARRSQKGTQWRATGAALITATKHSKDDNLQLFAACFCPFSQRVWVALEAKGLPYQYCETDLDQRTACATLLGANSGGLVPAIRQGDWACSNSSVILEYLEDISSEVPLLPTDPQLRAHCRLWIEHINNRIVPAFFALLKNTEAAAQSRQADLLQSHITSLVGAADEQGPYFLGPCLSLVDVHFAPFALRLRRLLGPLHGWTEPAPGTRWHRWLEALEGDAHVRATMSGDELYTATADALCQRAEVVTAPLA